MEEAAAAALADGVIVLREEIDRMYQLICNFDAIKTSMLVDREKNRPLEIDAICGAVLQRSRQQNSPAPLTGLVDALLRDAVGLPRSKTPLIRVI
jgi:2-dehydropantoate 2-reductase